MVVVSDELRMRIVVNDRTDYEAFERIATKDNVEILYLGQREKSGLKRELSTRPRAFLRVFGLRFGKNTIVVCCTEAFLRVGKEATLHSPWAGCWSCRVLGGLFCSMLLSIHNSVERST